jgi:hypothetical protein
MIHIPMTKLPFWMVDGKHYIWYRYMLCSYLDRTVWIHYLTIFGWEFTWQKRIRP